MSDQAAETTSTVNETAALNEEGWEWCLVEILGHRSHWCRALEVEKFGTKMLRVDIPIIGETLRWKTILYGGSSVFSFTLSDEETVMKRNKPYREAARLTYQQDEEEDEDRPF